MQAVEQREVVARNMRIRVSPRKMRLVLDLIRGKDVNEALAILQFLPNKSAVEVYKTVRSAQATADHNYDMDPDDLYIKRIYADDGPTYKRWKPRARGRVNQILKRTSHLTVVVAEKES
jgi:large subunit ribosomal protein L22